MLLPDVSLAARIEAIEHLLPRAGRGGGSRGAMRLSPSLALLGAALLAACASAPPEALRSGGDVVRAPTRETAEEAAELLREGRRRLSERLVDLRERDVVVWVQERLDARPYTVPSAGDGGFTLLRSGRAPRIHVLAASYRNTLLHELTHALLGPTWERLPQAAEEGLCDLMNRGTADGALRLIRMRCAARREDAETWSLRTRAAGKESLTFWGRAGGSVGSGARLEVADLLRLSKAEWQALDGAEAAHAYGAAHLLVERIEERLGVAGLHALCRRAAAEEHDQVPASWLLDAADIQDEASCLRIAREAHLAAAIQAALASDPFRSALAKTVERLGIGGLSPVEGAAALAERAQGELEVADVHLSFAELPGFQEWAVAAWDDLSREASEE